MYTDVTHEEVTMSISFFFFFLQAMRRDKNNMDHRYIELFLNSSPSGTGDGGGGFKPNRNFRNY